MIEQVQTLLSAWAVSFDLPVLDYIRTHLAFPILDKVMPIITMFGDGGVFWIAIALICLIFPKTRKTGWSMAVAMILGLLVCNVTLKPLIARIRPFDLHAQMTGETIKLLVKTPHDFSFPSGHTIACFEACTVLMLKNKWAGIPATILAFLVAISRLYLYVHYPTDVLFSVVAGTIFGFLGVGIVALIYKFRPPHKGRFEK